MQKVLAAMAFSAGMALGAVSFGIAIGPPPPPRVYAVPARPGPGFEWVQGYWYPVEGRYVWHAGYWTRPIYDGAHWVGPHYAGGRFYNGYWDGPRGRFEHDHRWDHDRDRDYHR